MDRPAAPCHAGLTALLVPALLVLGVAGLAAQERRVADSVAITAGARYAAGWLHRWLLGRYYRDLWTTPLMVELLDLGREGGGLTPTTAGGGHQTLSLRFRGVDGYQYSFRSVDKDPDVVPDEMKGTFVEDVAQDQISSAHPAGPAVVAALSAAAGILHTDPRLVVLPDDPRLGRFRERFAGALGFFERRATIEPGVPPFGGAAEIIDADTLLERVRRDPSNRLDLPGFLTCRLFDYLIGDWDRHQGQWTFLRRTGDTGAVVTWAVIPEDRDQAFTRYDGLILALARQYAPFLLDFGDKLPRAVAFEVPGRALDRRFLVEPEWPTWDSVVTALVAHLTDPVIDGAVRRLPPEYYAIDGARLAEALKARRAQLRAKAREYYLLLAREAEVHASDAAETALVERRPDGSSDVSLYAGVGAGAEEAGPYWRRRFLRAETKEVRIYLYGGADHVLVRGERGGIPLHIVAGGHATVANTSGGGGVHVYAADPPSTSGPVSVDTRPYTPPAPGRTGAPARDWGHEWRTVSWAGAGPDVGVFLGTGARIRDFGFRKMPFASELVVRGGYATGARTGRIDFAADVRRRNSRVRGLIDVRLSGIEVLRYNGLGNEVALTRRPDYYRVNEQLISVDPAVAVPVGPATLVLGPTISYARTREQAGRILADVDLYGEGGFAQAGVRGTLDLDSRDVAAAATRGVHLRVGGRLFPRLWDVRSAFGEVHGEASTYLTADSLPLRPTLALRAGGKRVWGAYPFQEAAFIGDAATARLGRQNRYGGDAAVYGNAELRLDLGRVFLLLPARFGVFGLGDVGRVFLAGETSSLWHWATGGGVWLAFLGRPNTVSLAVATSQGAARLYGSLGFAY